jgi:trk system potassium uptake protein
VRVFVIGAGQVGTRIVEALHGEQDVVVVDIEPERLAPLAARFDVVTAEADAADRRSLEAAGIADAHLVIACTSRDEVNLVAAIVAERSAPATLTIVRTTGVEYLDVWREGQLEVDFVVSSAQESAYAVARTIGVPAARQTDIFAGGQVQIVEFDVEDGSARSAVDVPLRDATLPADSRVAGIIRGDDLVMPRGDEAFHAGDRIVVVGSPQAARQWSELMSPHRSRVDDVVVVGAGVVGTAVARALVAEDVRVKVIEENAERARLVARELPDARVFHASAVDTDFLERERIADSAAAVFALDDDAHNQFAATLAKVYGVPITIAIVRHPIAHRIFRRADVDVAIDPRSLIAEEIVRFARDPRTQQVALLEGDRFEVVDIVVRGESELVGRPFRELPLTGTIIGAIVREGRAIFPHGDDELRPGDRAILFTEAGRVPYVERTL